MGVIVCVHRIWKFREKKKEQTQNGGWQIGWKIGWKIGGAEQTERKGNFNGEWYRKTGTHKIQQILPT